MAIRTYLTTTLGATHLFMLQDATRDGGSSGIATTLTTGVGSFGGGPICKGVSASYLSTTNAGSNAVDGAVIGNTGDINTGGDLYRERTVILWASVSDLANPTCVFEQGGGVNNFAFMAGIAKTLTWQAADSGTPFLIAQSNFLATVDRPYFLAGIWQQSSVSGSGNTVSLYINGVLQETVDLGDTSVFPSHTGDIVVGNSSDTLQAYNGSTMASATVSKNCNILGFYNDTTLTDVQLREIFERTTLADVEIVADTVANQQAALDALIGNSYAATNCAIRVYQATDATDYRLFFDTIDFTEDTTINDIHVQYVGPNTLTVEQCNGSDATVFSTPAEVDEDGTTINTGGGSITNLTGVYRVNGTTVTTVPVGTYTKIVFDTAGSYNLSGSTVSEIENVSGGALSITTDSAIATITDTGGGSVTTVLDSVLTFSDITSWQVYSSSADRSAETGALDSGTVSDDYNFQYVAATTYYLRLVVGSDILLKDVTPTSAGSLEVDLSTAALLIALNSAISIVNKGVQKASKFQVHRDDV